MGLFSSKPKIEFKRNNINPRYELVMESVYTIDKSITSSKTYISWDLLINQVYEDGYRLRLQTLEHTLLETDDSPMEDLFQAIRAMMKMFSEIDILVSAKGEVVTVYNQKEIKERFDRIKNELISFQGTSMRACDVFNIPESDLTTPPLLNTRVQAMEFFDVYFGALYGRGYPGNFIFKKRNLMQNLDLNYNITISKENVQEKPLFSKFYVKGQNFDVDIKKLIELWGQAPFVNKDELEFKGMYSGEYFIEDAYGTIEEATLTIDESFAPNFKLAITYTLKRIR